MSEENMETVEGESQQEKRPESRLIITKIVNENFKSYAGKQELGPFHKSFSSIVGPNGSGKSNVIDAMLFVFGYRSRKIRSKKLSQLIHNSENHKDVQSCTVSVHFQNIVDLPGDEFEVVPGSDFVVSRTARKDNSSDYYVNGRKSPFKEVAALLRGCGIDLDHNRFLILQGEVEQISMMKPKALTEHEEGMLEYLEDIIGSSRFKEPIELAAKEVEDLNEVRGEKLNRVKAVEKEKDELEDSKNEAVEYLSMENDITKHRNVLFQKYIYDCSENEQKATEKRDSVKAEFDEFKKQLLECSNKRRDKEEEHKKAYQQFEKLSAAAEKTKKDFAKYERDDLKIREDFKHNKLNSKKLEKSLQKEKQKLTELQGVPDKSQKQVEELESKKQDMEVKKKEEENKLAEVMAGLKNETQGLQAEKEAKETELMDWSKVVNDSKSKMGVAKSELEIYCSQHETAVSQLAEGKANLEKAIQTGKERKSEVEALEKELPGIKKDLKQAESDLTKAEEGEKRATGELRSLRSKVEEARSSFQTSRTKGKVLQALTEQKNSGRIKGIYGRLGDLGAIDDKYDVAISTACSALDHIVCDSIETAQKCINFLKTNNLGQASFIGLDKMESHRKAATSRIQTPENVPRLFDLVRVKDDKVRTAFYFALQNTLVGEDLEKATRIAYQGSRRWRVVTLQGQLIDQSGTMSGGGTRVARGRMCSSFVSDTSVTQEQLNQMEKKMEAESSSVEEFRESKKKLEELVDELKKRKSNIEHQLEKNKMEIQVVGQQEKELKEQIKHLEENVKKTTPDQARLKELQQAVSKHNKEWQKASSSAEKIESEVQRLHKKIMEIGGAKLKSQQTKVDTLTKVIDDVTAQITKANVAIKTSHRNIKKAEDKIASLEKESEESKAELAGLEAKIATLEENAIKVLEAYERSEKEIEEMGGVLAKLRQESEELEKDENEAISKKVDMKHALEKYETVLKENQQKVKYWQKERSKLSLQPTGLSDENQETELPELTNEQLMEADKEAVMYEISVLEEKMKLMKPNMSAIAEYRKKEEAYLARVSELDEITSQRDNKRREHEAMRKQRLDEFMAGFSIITTKLKEMYQMITLGGDAELELVDSLDPFSEGIVFSVRPPKKSWKNISNLSGGEKTLSSLALVFALHHYKPTPLYVMDEIDAALDFRNVSIVANYIKERTKNAQFIIISLRNNMFELADRLIGIFKTDNCTKSAAINPALLAAQTVQ